MNINIYGNKVEVTQAISDYIKEKFNNVHKPEKILSVDFKIGVEKDGQYVRFNTQHNKENIHIEAKNENLYAAIDELMDKIRVKFKKVKEKPVAHRHEKAKLETE